jgi:hypothetical protein
MGLQNNLRDENGLFWQKSCDALKFTQQAMGYPRIASPLYPLSASGEGKDEVRGEAKFKAELRGIIL